MSTLNGPRGALTRTERNHATFLRELRGSDIGRWIVARHLVLFGNTVTIPPIYYAPKREMWHKYSDKGDLFVQTESGEKYRVEVKHLGWNWTNSRDWPHKHYFVVAKYTWDQVLAGKIERPRCFFSLSDDCQVGAVVDSATADRWYVEERGDRRFENYKQERYCAPLKCVEFFPIRTE